MSDNDAKSPEDDEIEARLRRAGWHVVARVPSDPKALTLEDARAVFGGDIEGGLRELLRLGLEAQRRQAQATDTPSESSEKDV